MAFNQLNIFRVIVFIVGAFIIFVGINVGFGGIQTLGWQVPSDFVTVTNEMNYRIQDNHVRFLGGFFGTVGIFMIVALRDLHHYQTALRLIFVLMFIGGIIRLTAPQPTIVFDMGIITSFIAEVVLMPILFFWLPRIPSIEKSS